MPNQAKYKAWALRLEPKDLDALKEIAEYDGTTMTGVIRQHVRKRIRQIRKAMRND